MARKKDDKWIQSAIRRPGRMRKYCGGKVTDACIARAMKSKDPSLRKAAQLAKTLRKMRRKGKK